MHCAATGIEYLALDDERQGIVHVVGPEQGFTLPGTTLVCGDSHSATHGAFGALAFGIGGGLMWNVFRLQKSKGLYNKTVNRNEVHILPIRIKLKQHFQKAET